MHAGSNGGLHYVNRPGTKDGRRTGPKPALNGGGQQDRAKGSLDSG
jgi:hypothetical protein